MNSHGVMVIKTMHLHLNFKQHRCKINCMEKRILEDGFKPRYYTGNKVITSDHVARFYGACLCRMNHCGRSIEQIFPTREMMDAVLYH